MKKGKRHCELKLCIKTHEGITCKPDGVWCEYYIGEGKKNEVEDKVSEMENL